ncbi:MAG TPA: hypothetical protein V6D17_03330 [Candidatus Obscuribacterales bacterium]
MSGAKEIDRAFRKAEEQARSPISDEARERLAGSINFLDLPPGGQADEKPFELPKTPLERLAGILMQMMVPPNEGQISSARNTARTNLDKQLGKLVPSDTKEKAIAIQDAVLAGDLEALQKAVSGIAEGRMRDFADEINKNLQNHFSAVGLTTDRAGNLIVFGEEAQALKIFRNGDKPDVVEKAQDADDKTLFRDADYVDEDASTVATAIGHTGVLDITRDPKDQRIVAFLRRLSEEQMTEFFKMLLMDEMRRQNEAKKNAPLRAHFVPGTSSIHNVA